MGRCQGAAATARRWVSDNGELARLSGYHFFVSLTIRRADLDLPQFDLPPAAPVFSPNPVAELVVTNTGGWITLKLRLTSPPARYTVVQGPAPTRTGVRRLQRFPVLGLLAPPVEGWCDVTELFVARYGVPKPGTAVWFAPASISTATPMCPKSPAPASRWTRARGLTPATTLGCRP